MLVIIHLTLSPSTLYRVIPGVILLPSGVPQGSSGDKGVCIKRLAYRERVWVYEQ